MKSASTFICILLLLAAAGCGEAPTPTSVDTGNPNDFTMNDQFGKPVSLSDFRGKVVVLDFWATWCGPCMVGMPEVKKTWEKYRDRDFMIVGVSLDYDTNDWKEYISRNDLSWTHVADGKGWNNAIGRKYGVTAIPEMKLLDREGNIVTTAHGIGALEDAIISELEK